MTLSDWDDNLIYIASKKAYLIMNKDTGNILQSITHDKLSKRAAQLTCIDFPVMALSKTKCLILEQPTVATYFDETQGIKKQTTFRLDASKVLSTITLQENYVIIVYEGSIAVYNSSTGDKLEERVTLDKQFKFKTSCVNFSGNEILVVSHNNSSGKNIIQSEVHQMVEIPPEEQI